MGALASCVARGWIPWLTFSIYQTRGLPGQLLTFSFGSAVELPETASRTAPSAALSVEMYRGADLLAKQKTPVQGTTAHPEFQQDFAFNVSQHDTAVRFVITATEGAHQTPIGRMGFDIGAAVQGPSFLRQLFLFTRAVPDRG